MLSLFWFEPVASQLSYLRTPLARQQAQYPTKESATVVYIITMSSEDRKRPAEDPAAKKAPPKVARTTATSTPAATAAASTASTATTTTSADKNKAYKGLRHFSMMVCKKVEEKGTTTYNQVADDLVQAVLADAGHAAKFDEKNIRRRVYDALNVLMAMDIIGKDKKQISWKGLPTTAAQDVELLQRECAYRQQEVARKRSNLRELLTQQVCFRNLVQHNKRRDGEMVDTAKDNKIPLPFIVVNTSSNAVIQCNMSRDLTDVMFDFSMPFEINDDNTILKRLGM